MEHASYLLMSLGLVSLIAAIANIRTFLNIIPSLFACALRWKEAVNLEDSVSLARMRNTVFLILLMPAVIFISYYSLLDLGFTENMVPDLRFAITLGILAVYAGLRAILNAALRPKNFNSKLWAVVIHSLRNYCTISALVTMVTAGVMSLLGCSQEAIKNTSLIILGVIYIGYLLRRMQIFSSGSTYFSSILYLCALEILPTGLLVAAGIIF